LSAANALFHKGRRLMLMKLTEISTSKQGESRIRKRPMMVMMITPVEKESEKPSVLSADAAEAFPPKASRH